MSTFPLPDAPLPVSPAPPPTRQPQPPAFVATDLRFGKIGNGEQLAIGFLFTDANAAEHIVVLTNEFGVLDPKLVGVFASIIADVTPGEVEQPVVTCRGCGARIFGPLIERGACLICEPV